MFDMEVTVKFESKAKAGGSVSTTEVLKMEILDIYNEKIQLGQSMHKVLMETNAKEESLSHQRKEALDLYTRQISNT